MWRLEHVVLMVGSDVVAGGTTAGIVLTGVLKVLFPRSIPLRM
jgi:hypothetical protein